MIITEILERNARNYPLDIALVERDDKGMRGEINWLDFNLEANKLANALILLGVKKKDKIVQLMTNSIEWLPIYFGILKAGAIVSPFNFRFNSKEISLCSQTISPKVFIFGEEFIDRISEVKEKLDRYVKIYIYVGIEEKKPEYAIYYKDLLKIAGKNNPKIFLEITDDAALYFTSGTTGMPKAALLTHRNLEFSCYVESNHHKQTKEDVFLCMPPLYHTGAKMHWFGSFLVGAKSVLLKGVYPENILKAVSEEKVSIVWLLVPWAYDILTAIENKTVNLNDYDLSKWWLMHIGAQPVPKSLIEKWLKVFKKT